MPRASELNPATIAAYRQAFGIDAIAAIATSGLTFVGAWAANGAAPTPTANGQYWIVSVAGTTNLGGINSWGVGDWAIFKGAGVWVKAPNPAQQLANDLASTAAGKGSELVAFLQSGTGAVARTIQDRMRETISVLDFIPVVEHAAIRAGTSSYDCRAGIQAAIDYSIYGGGKGTVHIPAGKYIISGPIHLGYGTSYSACVLEGAGSMYRGESVFNGTALVATHSNAPAIVIQGGRRTAVRHLAVVGANDSFLKSGGHGFNPSFRDIDLATWIGPALHANANSRYAPYAGIAVDPYSGVRPGVSYPDVAYPAAYVGTPVQYNKSFTDVATIEDVWVGGFVVGLVVQPGDADGNGDHISIKDSRFEHCAYGVSLGNSQGRCTNIDNSQFFGIHTCFTNIKHGKLRGKFGGVVRGCSFNGCIQLVDIDPGYNGAFPLDGCYGELIWRIGNMGFVSSTNAPLVLRDCEFSLQNNAYGGGASLRGLPNNIVNAPANCVVVDAGKYDIATVLNIGGQAEIRGGTYIVSNLIDPLVAPNVTDDLIALFGSTLGVIANHTTAPRIKRFSYPQWGSGEHGAIAAQVMGDVFPAPMGNRLRPMPPTTRQVIYEQAGPSLGLLPVQAPVYSWNKSALVISAADPSNATFDFAAMTAGYRPYGVSKGDTITDSVTGTIFLIKSVSGTVATCEALNNYYTELGVRHYQTGEFNTSLGYVSVVVNRVFACRYPLLGDIASGNATASNVGRADSYFPPGQIAVGDYLLVSEHWFRPFAIGTKINAIDTGARTIQFSSNAKYSQARIPMCFWVRAEL